MMVSYRLYWTLWILSCFGQYLCQDLQIPEQPNKAEGDRVVFTPNNPPDSTSILITQWFFGTTLIVTLTSGVTTETPAYVGRASIDINTQALTLKDLRLSDSGIYGLKVTLTDGGFLTGETSLQVEKLSVNLTGPEGPLIEGKSSVNITSKGNGNIINSVQWMKDNRPLSPSNSIIFSPDNRSVSISPVQRSDSGEYKCTYSNPVSSETATYSLIINYGPDDVSINGPDVVNSGVRVSLFCSANSVPSASFRWMFNGTDTGVTTDTFTIDETDFTHSGDYDCTAWNNVTNRSASQRHVLLVKVGGGGGGLSPGAIVGIVFGVLVAVAAICGLIVYLIKTKKMPKLTLTQNGRSSGAAQRRQEPDLNYADISHFQKGSGEKVILGNRSEPNTEYAEVKRSGTKSTAPPPPYGSQVSNPPLRR